MGLQSKLFYSTNGVSPRYTHCFVLLWIKFSTQMNSPSFVWMLFCLLFNFRNNILYWKITLLFHWTIKSMLLILCTFAFSRNKFYKMWHKNYYDKTLLELYIHTWNFIYFIHNICYAKMIMSLLITFRLKGKCKQ